MDYFVGSGRTPLGNTIDTVSWDRVSGAESYDLEWKYPDPFFTNVADADAECEGDRCTARFERNPRQRHLEIRVRATMTSRNGLWSDWSLVRGRRSVGEPKITALVHHPGRTFITNNVDDVTVYWDADSVRDATGYYVERRYVQFSTASRTIEGQQFSFPDFDSEPTVVVESVEYTDAGSPYKFPDAFEERYRDKRWTLQFRVTPYNVQGRGEPSQWVSLGLAELIDALYRAGPCAALDTIKNTYSLGGTIWSAVTIIALVLAGTGPAGLALSIAKSFIQDAVTNTTFNRLKSFAECYEGVTDEMIDGLKGLIPPLGWFMDASGLTDRLSDLGCHYESGATITPENILSIDFSRWCK